MQLREQKNKYIILHIRDYIVSVEKLIKNFKDCEKAPYSTFLNEVIQNIKDTETLAVWIYLSSMPSDWQVNKKQLMHHFSIGERKIKSIISELHQMNLLEYIIEKDDQGRFKSHSAKILCGTKFKQIDSSTDAEIAPMDPVVQKTSGAETARAVLTEHTNKDIYKINKFKNICPSGDGRLHDDEILNNSGFHNFWEIYPRKENKKNTMRIWLKIFKKSDYSLSEIILKHVQERVKNDPDWTNINSPYIPLPSTYLNGERWNDKWVVRTANAKDSAFMNAIKSAWED